MLTEAEKWQRKLKVLKDKKQEIYNTIAQAMSEAQLKIDKHVASCKHPKEHLKFKYFDNSNGWDRYDDYSTNIECEVCGKRWVHVEGSVTDIPRSK